MVTGPPLTSKKEQISLGSMCKSKQHVTVKQDVMPTPQSPLQLSHTQLEEVLETLSAMTGATTTAYRKQIFCSGHVQKLNNWLQPAVVFTLATPHSLFWRNVDNVAVYSKVFSPYRTTHNEGPFWRLLSDVFWGEILQWTYLRQKNTLAQAASRQIHRKARSSKKSTR